MSRHPQGGWLVVDKPVGPTSHDVVMRVRRALKTREVGHTGTLDPFASGVMVVMVGQLTRLAEAVGEGRKTYVAEVKLGVETTTDDGTGEVVKAVEGSATDGEIEAALVPLRGTISQVPPSFSAKHVDGQRAYALAREGVAVELKPSVVEVHTLRVLERAGNVLRLEVECGKGTYIRALARDLGRALGLGGHLTALRRTRVGPFSVEESVAVEALSPESLQPPAALLRLLPHAHVDEAAVARVKQGRSDVNLTVCDRGWDAGTVGVVQDGTTLWALARAHQALAAGSVVPGSAFEWRRRFPTGDGTAQ
jgi:tRNA pseudouridine55 synthase